MIASGNVYKPEELGWFRITSTVRENGVDGGIGEVWGALGDAEMERRDWE
jgi:hypothetical protein